MKAGPARSVGTIGWKPTLGQSRFGGWRYSAGTVWTLPEGREAQWHSMPSIAVEGLAFPAPSSRLPLAAVSHLQRGESDDDGLLVEVKQVQISDINQLPGTEARRRC
jgi:hypothetical protein